MPRAIIYPHKVKELKARQAEDRQNLLTLLDHHLLTPECQGCREAFEDALAAYREKYAWVPTETSEP